MANAGPVQSPRTLAAALSVLGFSLFLWTACLTFDGGDWPSPNQFPHHSPPANACGSLGAWFAYHLRHALGDGAFPALLFLTLASAVRLTRGAVESLGERLLGVGLIVLCTCVSSALVTDRTLAELPVGTGGVVGFALARWLASHLDRWGTIIVVLCTMIVGLLFATEGWILKLPSVLIRAGRASAKAVRARPILPRLIPLGGLSTAERSALQGGSGEPPGLAERLNEASRRIARRHASDPTLEADRPRIPPGSDQGKDEIPCTGVEGRGRSTPGPVTDDSGIAGSPSSDVKRRTPQSSTPKNAPGAGLAAPTPSLSSGDGPGASSSSGQRGQPVVKVNYPMPSRALRVEAYPRQIENWTLPPVSLLRDPEYGFTTQQETMVREQARVLERTLEEFRVDARVVEIDTGPVITMFELRLGAGIKVSQIATLSNDIARALKAHAIRVVAPISGKNTVGIEVPNNQKEKVRLKELMGVAGKRAAEMALPLFLGKDAGGGSLVFDLAAMPHLLIAGTTGSGKSVCMNSLIVSLLMTKRPDHVKMILVDPKMVEMSQFKDVPHLMCPIVTDVARAEKILEWAVTKMDERYEMLAEARVKNIAGYNGLGADELYRRIEPTGDEERARIPKFMPYIVILIDELADLMMTSGKEVEHHLSRLAQKSRAVGIHIIVATQRPEAKVVTGLIKSNLPCRVCFRVASRMDSRIVLDQNGGEVLMGQGDMLFLPPGVHKLVRAQGTYLEDSEVHAVLDDLASRSKPEFHPELISLRASGSEGDLSMRDPLFEDAVQIILESRRGSVSLLQRRLTIGYSRASRLIDQMAEAGIVGAYKGSQAREVIISMEEWDALRAQWETDLRAGYEADANSEPAASR